MVTTTTTRSEVVSPDGTTIAYHSSGEGPPVLLVHGGLGDHTRWEALRPLLTPHVTVHAMDRRGRGASGDHPEYQLEREFEDVAAVIDAITNASGSPVDVYGHSFGGLCAFGAAPLTSNISRLVLYEGWPPVDPEAWVPPEGLMERLDAMLEDGDRERLVETFLREYVKMTDEQVEAYQQQPSWPARVAAAHTILREERAFPGTPFDPADAAKVTVPTRLLVGEDQALDWRSEVVSEAIPDATVSVLEGQGHTADITAPELVADQLLTFVGARS